MLATQVTGFLPPKLEPWFAFLVSARLDLTQFQPLLAFLMDRPTRMCAGIYHCAGIYQAKFITAVGIAPKE